MRFPALLCGLCVLCASLFADDPKPTTIVTLSGARYEKAIVTALSPDAISITHSTGVARIPFTDLLPEIQKQYGYDPIKAAAYQKSLVDAERARIEAEKVEWAKKEKERFRRELELRAMTSPIPTDPQSNAEMLQFLRSQHDQP